MKRQHIVFVAFLIGCLVLGGSSQGIWSTLVLQLTAVGILIFALSDRPRVPLHPRALFLGLLIVASIVWIIIQLLPLPPGVWTQIPGRELIVDGYRLTGTDLPWLPISLAPNSTIASLMGILPALAVFAWLTRRDQIDPRLISYTILAVTCAAVLLGILQRADQSFQLYPVTNTGATGFFANSNHMGALLVVAVPFLIATSASARPLAQTQNPTPSWLWKVIAFLGAGVLVTGTAVNGSLAVLLLIAPVFFASLFLLIPASKIRLGRVAASIAAISVVIIGAVGWLISSGLRQGDQSSFTIRQDIWETTVRLIGEHGLFGAGLGAFGRLYPVAENPSKVDWVYVNLAHNDYLQLILELGISGLVLTLLFLAWWVFASIKIWATADADVFAKAATIASAALLLHSAVDYPLRTVALSAIFSVCLALMVQRTGSGHSAQARHLRLEDL